MSDSATPAPQASSNPIVIRLGRIGDMILLTPLLHYLHRRYGKPCFVIGSGNWTRDVYCGNPDVAGVWSATRHLPLLLDINAWNAVALLRRSGSAPIYVCEDYRSRTIRIRRLLALSGVDPARCIFMPDLPPSAQQHYIDRFLETGTRTPAALGAGDSLQSPTAPARVPRLPILQSEQTDCEAWLARRGWSGRPLIIVQPGNHRSMGLQRRRTQRLSKDDKAWPPARWAALLRRVHDRLPDAIIVLRGVRSELPMLRELQSAAGLDCVAVVALGLRPSFALCRAAHSMISVDTGPAHAAAALGLPLVVIFGAASPRCWIPHSPGSPVIAVGGPPTSLRADQVDVDTVFSAWCELLQEPAAYPNSPARALRTM